MAKKIKIKPGETVGLKLVPKERQMLLDSLIFTSRGLEDRLRLTTAGDQQVQLTLDDLDELAGCVAAEANHAKHRKLQRKLDRIFERIEGLLEMFEEG
ncbi:MAG: hypothetical protein WBF17_13530 [Phycisphaerae bacterium]